MLRRRKYLFGGALVVGICMLVFFLAAPRLFPKEEGIMEEKEGIVFEVPRIDREILSPVAITSLSFKIIHVCETEDELILERIEVLTNGRILKIIDIPERWGRLPAIGKEYRRKKKLWAERERLERQGQEILAKHPPGIDISQLSPEDYDRIMKLAEEAERIRKEAWALHEFVINNSFRLRSRATTAEEHIIPHELVSATIRLREIKPGLRYGDRVPITVRAILRHRGEKVILERSGVITYLGEE